MFKQICNTLFQKTKMLHAVNKNAQNYCSLTKHSMQRDVEAERIVWVDLEMTGLDINTRHIMEIACIITDEKLNIVAEGPDIVIHQPSDILDTMDEWCIKQHGKTGLTDACKSSNISLKQAEQIVFNFIQEYTQPGISPLAGNSVYMDRLFLKKYMPSVEQYLHYRIIDVSTVKELCRRWNPEIYRSSPKKLFLHRSLEDIRESIKELKWYREHFMKISFNKD